MNIALKNSTPELDYWSKIYNTDGHRWGDHPSTTAIYANDHLQKKAKIFEIGYGYGRDLVYLAQQGHSVSGIEKSSIGHQKTTEKLNNRRNSILYGDFTKAALNENKYDAVISHRVLNSGDGKNIPDFVEQCSKILKPNGLLCISARDLRDFNDKTMVMHKNGIAEYKDRPGHIINFWDKDRFINAFNKHFSIEQFVETTELESNKSQENTYITRMVARKRILTADI